MRLFCVPSRGPIDAAAALGTLKALGRFPIAAVASGHPLAVALVSKSRAMSFGESRWTFVEALTKVLSFGGEKVFGERVNERIFFVWAEDRI